MLLNNIVHRIISKSLLKERMRLGRMRLLSRKRQTNQPGLYIVGEFAVFRMVDLTWSGIVIIDRPGPCVGKPRMESGVC